MINKTTEDYTIRGKTGWVFSDDKEQNIAWYIGFIDFENAHYYFATRLKPTSALDMDKFPGIRKELTIEAFKQMRWIKNH